MSKKGMKRIMKAAEAITKALNNPPSGVWDGWGAGPWTTAFVKKDSWTFYPGMANGGHSWQIREVVSGLSIRSSHRVGAFNRIVTDSDDLYGLVRAWALGRASASAALPGEAE